MKRFLIIYFIFCVSFFTIFSSGFIDSQDGFQYLTVARRIYYDKTFEMPVESFENGENIHMSLVRNEEGKYYSPTGLGYTLALIPSVIIESMFLKKSGLGPISAFPLHNDWPVLLFASFTNTFFAALLIITMYKIFQSYKLSHKSSVIFSFLTVVSTNLFVYTKHSFAHMMFISFLVLSFYYLRYFILTKKKRFLFFSGLSYGIVIISYNLTFILPVIPFILYYLQSSKFKLNKKSLLNFAVVSAYFTSGALPFIVMCFWFNWIRFGDIRLTAYAGGASAVFAMQRKASVTFEGLWGVLFSPGRSIFLYTPILLFPLIYWSKLKKNHLPEIILLSSISIIYLVFYGTALGGPDYPVWHGESSWGPRYMLPIIPFCMIIVVLIIKNLRRIQKLFILYPLLLLGLFIQIPALLLPYQIKFSGLQTDAFINDRNFNVYEYGNEIPRYTPLLTMARILTRRLKNSDSLFDHGIYNLRLYDGFNIPFYLGDYSSWREILPEARMSFNNVSNNKPGILSLNVKNHVIEGSSNFDAHIIVVFNDSTYPPVIIKPNEENIVTIDLNDKLQDNNLLELNTNYLGTSSAILKGKQVVFLQDLKFDDYSQNLNTIDFPYVSPVSEHLYDAKYTYWGGYEKDPWVLWHMRSGAYEQTFDLWWLRPYHYRDLPKQIYYTILSINAVLFTISLTLTLKYTRKDDRNKKYN